LKNSLKGKRTPQCIESMVSGQHSALLHARRLGQRTGLDIESGIRLASGRNITGSTEYEQIRGRVTRSGHDALHQVGTLRPRVRGYSWTESPRPTLLHRDPRRSKCEIGSKCCNLSRLQTLGPRESSHS